MWIFYTFKHLVMPTTDSSTPVQTSGTTSQVTPQTDEFDLGITQTSVQEVPEKTADSLSEKLENADQAENQTFDFSLDLPEEYSDSSVQKQTPISQNQDSEVQEASEESIGMSSSQAMEENHFLQEGGDDMVLQEEDVKEGGPAFDVSSEEWLVPQVSNTVDAFEGPLQEEASLNLEDATPSMELSEETVWEVVPADEGFLLSQNQDAFSTPSSVSDSLESELPQQENIQEEETAAQPSELPVQEVSPSLASEKEESNKVLNLDEMVSQFSSNHSQNIAQAEMDPFSAMKATLEAQESQKNVSTVQSDTTSLATEPTPVHNLQPVPFEVQSSALQQSSGVQQETNEVSNDQLVQTSSEVQNQISSSAPQTLDLDALASMPSTIGSSNPLTAPVAYPQQVNQTSAWNKKGIFVTLASVVLFVAVGAMMYIKYPDLFTFSGVNPWSLTGLVAQSPLDEEHGAAPELSLTWDAQFTGDDMLSDNEITPIEPQEISGDFVEEEWSGSIQTIDLTQGDSSAGISTEMSIKNENSESTSSLSDSSKDPLSSVESLVGPINNNDVIKQEITEYQRKGTELKETGTAQNKRIMIKYGLAVEKEAQRILDDLANGGNIDISTWSSLKTKLDGYLAKASNV